MCGGGFFGRGQIGVVVVVAELKWLLCWKNWRKNDERRIAKALFDFVLKD